MMKSNRYALYLADPDNDGVPNTVQAMRPHDLIGQRGFSFFVTGTLTVLENNQSLSLDAVDDAIIRGDLNLPGAGSELSLQSDEWVYWEGSGNISGNLIIRGGQHTTGIRAGTSVLIPDTSRIVTSGAGSVIDIEGDLDVDILGTIVAGGRITETGVTWAGPDSQVRIQAGQQVFLDTGVLAAGRVSIIGGTAGADDSGLSVLITPAGGITAAGLTSGTAGSVVEIQGTSSLQMMGSVLSGGSMSLVFNSSGQRIGENITWSPKPSSIRVDMSAGQAWIGGVTANRSGDLVETGGALWASELIDVSGERHRTRSACEFPQPASSRPSILRQPSVLTPLAMPILQAQSFPVVRFLGHGMMKASIWGSRSPRMTGIPRFTFELTSRFVLAATSGRAR
jgi:uncharacterized Zn-binding protein involved in type VI secretion